MTSKNPKKRPRPSYEDGELRDPSIEKMQDRRFGRNHLLQLIRQAVTRSGEKAEGHRNEGT